jgi:hypothetical protein
LLDWLDVEDEHWYWKKEIIRVKYLPKSQDFMLTLSTVDLAVNLERQMTHIVLELPSIGVNKYVPFSRDLPMQ